MTHVKTDYGDGGNLKVCMYKDNGAYRVTSKTKLNKNSKKTETWRTVKNKENIKSKQKADEIYKNILKEF